MNSFQAVFDQGVEKIFVGGSSNEPKGLLKEISELAGVADGDVAATRHWSCEALLGNSPVRVS